jgi:hypothetical protein
MTSSIVTDTRWCPDRGAPMRLTRVLPTVLPEDCAPETRVFRCTRCGAVATHTVRNLQSLQRSGSS